VTKTLTGSTLALLLALGAGAFVLNLPSQSARADGPHKPAFAKTNPDLVRWNQDRAAASKQAAEVGRPLLVFQLLGSLDREFC
jgi:hypothetical protein